jgi:DNA-directed RNA polymerase II subunit RPB2
VHKNPDELKNALLRLRRRASIGNDTSIAFDHGLAEIRIYNDWGRVCRPLYVVEDSACKITRADIARLLVHPSTALCVH